MSKEEILTLLTDKNGNFSASHLKWTFIDNNPILLDTLFPFSENKTLPPIETIYRYINDIVDTPKCPICGNKTEFQRYARGYKVFCSDVCKKSELGKEMTRKNVEETWLSKYGTNIATKSYEVKAKIIRTNNEKYNGNSPSCDKTIKQKQTETFNARYENAKYTILEKRKNTCLERYGVPFVSQLTETQDKMLATKKSRYGSFFNKEKYTRTCLDKYGVDYYAKTEEFKRKQKDTLIERYGVEYPLQNEEIFNKMKKTNLEKYGYATIVERPNNLSQESYDKMWDTKKKRKNTNTSRAELEVEQYLCRENIEYVKEYVDERYPWHCDFYIPKQDLFIEIQGSWTHGKHPFNPNNERDVSIVEKWRTKSNEINSKGARKTMYATAIKVWTESDVAKRRTAQINNLNYFEIFSDDPKKCIEDVENILKLVK